MTGSVPANALFVCLQDPAAGEIALLKLIMGLLGGLALFLYGMDKMAHALKATSGERMKAILGKLTGNRVMGILTGAFVTAVIQSSSVTTVLLVGFITAGLLSFSQSIAVIMGANIGTTITAQIIAFKATEYAPLLIAVGFGMLFLTKVDRIKQYGAGIMGLGLIFLGMAAMGDAMRPLRDYTPFLEWMVRLEHPLLGILIGSLFTALVQSSSATTGIVIALATQGLITLPAGIALVLGANIGTCITAALATIGRPREAVRAAAAHTIFNIMGVLVWVGLVDQLAWMAASISPQSGTQAASVPRQIANAHSIFNIVNTVLFVGLSTQLARFVEWLVPDRPLEEEEAIRAQYLDLDLLNAPGLGLDAARMEVLRQATVVKSMLAKILPEIFQGSHQSLDEIRAMDNQVDALHGYIVTYLGKISQTALSEAQTEELMKLLETVNDLENIGDLIETNLVMLGKDRAEEGFEVSETTRDVMTEFHGAVSRALDAAIIAATQRNREAAQTVIDMKTEINRLSDSANRHEAHRLVAREPNRLSAYKLETDVLENLKRIYYFSKRMARASLPGQQGMRGVEADDS